MSRYLVEHPTARGVARVSFRRRRDAEELAESLSGCWRLWNIGEGGPVLLRERLRLGERCELPDGPSSENGARRSPRSDDLDPANTIALPVGDSNSAKAHQRQKPTEPTR